MYPLHRVHGSPGSEPSDAWEATESLAWLSGLARRPAQLMLYSRVCLEYYSPLQHHWKARVGKKMGFARTVLV